MTEKNYARIDKKNLSFKSYFFQLWSSFLIVRPFIRLFYKLTILGKENIPQNKKCIFAPNHISYFDPYLVFIAIKKPIAFMAKQELFQNKYLAHVLERLCAFAVNRQKLEVSTIKSVKDVMKTKDWNLCIFPQGGIFRNKKIEKINRGFIAIAKMSKTDIIPMSIVGSETYNWKPFKGHIIVKIGKSISCELSDEDIIKQWAEQVADMTGYELAYENIEEQSLQKVN